MNGLKLKVCGMRDAENIRLLCRDAEPDYIGFVFYEHSPRFVGQVARVAATPAPVKRVGVFVNERVETVTQLVNQHKLGVVQLHGEEPAEACAHLAASGVEVIKSFPIASATDFEMVVAYEGAAHYFLFDTRGDRRGGNGQAFNWRLLQHYRGATRFFLSGGIGPENIKQAMLVHHPYLYGIDINSKVESMPGVKDMNKVQEVKRQLQW
jgi:phosphoribosylanthranilate isomerase